MCWCLRFIGSVLCFFLLLSFFLFQQVFIHKSFGLRLKQIFEVPIIKLAQTYILRQRHRLIISNFCCLQCKSRSHSNTGVYSFRISAILDQYLKFFEFALFKILFINKLDGPSVKTTFSPCIFIVQNVLFTPVTFARVEKDSVLIIQLNVQAIKFSVKCLFRQIDVELTSYLVSQLCLNLRRKLFSQRVTHQVI